MKYKKIMKYVPWCNKCKKEIRGNGSIVSPYECDCGKWEWDSEESDYKLKK